MDINLDAMWRAEVWAFSRQVYANPRKVALELFPARPRGYVRATKDLGHYATNKATAMDLRLDGKINRALAYEEICDRIYNRLPDFARW